MLTNDDSSSSLDKTKEIEDVSYHKVLESLV